MSNKVKPLTSEEQYALREKAKSELERLEIVYSDDVTREKIHRFKEKFGICEVVYKVILEDHQFNKTGKHPARMKVDMTQVPHALAYAGYDFEFCEQIRRMTIHFVSSCHVEVCCLLERLRSAKDHIEITIDAEDYYRIKYSDKKQDE